MVKRRRARNGEPKAFLEDAYLHESDDCLIWPFALRKGYALLYLDGKMQTAHRVVCEHKHGPAPFPDAEAAHTCGNSSCVSPQHVRWATAKDNQADRRRHGTDNSGPRNPHSKIDKRKAKYIRECKGKFSAKTLAEVFGVHQTTIWAVQRGDHWTSRQKNK